MEALISLGTPVVLLIRTLHFQVDVLDDPQPPQRLYVLDYSVTTIRGSSRSISRTVDVRKEMAQPEPSLLSAASCKGGCGTTTDLCSTSCGHMTLCFHCAKVLAHIAAPCPQCGVSITKLIKEYKVRAYKQSLEGGEEATRYTISMQGVEFRASPSAPDWCPFRKVVHGLKKPLTFQEAEEHVNRGRQSVDKPKTPMAAAVVKTPRLATTPSVGVKRKARADASEDVTDSSSNKKSRPQATVEKCENAASKGCPFREVVHGLKKPLTVQEGAEHLKPAVGRKPVDEPKTPMTAYALKTLRSASTPSAGGKRKDQADASKDVTELMSNKKSKPQTTPRSCSIPSAGVQRKAQANAFDHVADSSSIKKSEPQVSVKKGEKAAPKKGVVRRHVPVAVSKPRTLLWDCELIRSL